MNWFLVLTADGQVFLDLGRLGLVIRGGQLFCGFLSQEILDELGLFDARFPRESPGFEFDFSIV